MQSRNLAKDFETETELAGKSFIIHTVGIWRHEYIRRIERTLGKRP